MSTRTKGIGIGVTPPTAVCADQKCPFHGALKVRGTMFEGIVIKRPFHKDATVEWNSTRYVPKYERYQRTRSRVKAYNTSCINAEKGDKVKIMECRPLSKTKRFVIVEKIGKEYLFKAREEALAEAKVKPKKEELTSNLAADVKQ